MKTKGNILVIEDDEIFRSTLVKALKKQGYSVDGVADGEEALKLVKKKQVDLIVADVRLPGGMDGIEIVRKIKKVNADIKTMAIIMTGFADEAAPVRAIKVGVDDYIYKPFRLDSFLQSVENNLQALELERKEKEYKQELKEMKKVISEHNIKIKSKTQKRK